MRFGQWLGTAVDRLRESLWILPAAGVALALLSGWWLSDYEPSDDGVLGPFAFGGGPDAARSILEVIAGTALTVTSVTFSLTLVALQMAASQYSPRLLSSLLRDQGNKVVLTTFIGTFAFAMVVLRAVRAGDETGGAFVPGLAITAAMGLGLASVAALVYFIDHISQSIRIDQLMSRVEQYTLGAIAQERKSDDGDGDPEKPLRPPDGASEILAHDSGYTQTAGVDALLELLAERDVTVLYRRAVGEWVTNGTVLAWAWGSDGEAPDDAIARAANQAVGLGAQRTVQQDVSFGIRQLVDIAVKALSPGVNDPTTAVDALGHLTVLLTELAQYRSGPHKHIVDGTARVIIPGPTFEDYLGLACSQIAHYGAGDVAVVRRLLRMLEDVGGVVAEDFDRNRAVAAEIDRVLSEADEALTLAEASASVRRAAEVARSALTGDLAPSRTFTL